MTNQTTLPFKQQCIEPDCTANYDLNEAIYVCRACGGLLDIERTQSPDLQSTELQTQWRQRMTSGELRDCSGVWRFREVLPFVSDVDPVSLNEGNTPLYIAPRSAAYCQIDSLQLKHQGVNPTGSFKDTGMTVAVTQARLLGTRLVACASTGNTAASLAAYAARAKLAQSLDYGAKVLEIEGNFDSCMREIRELSEDGSLYLVNSINPFRIEGQKTVAFELAEQLGWRMPDHLVVPGGNLGNSSAFGKGFRELLALDLIERMPRISVIQAVGAAPFATYYQKHQDTSAEFIDEPNPKTLASAIKIGAPVSWKKALRAVGETGGVVLTVTEQEIADAKAIIGRDGIGCEPASATTVAGIKKMKAESTIQPNETVVAVLTGHVLKDTDYVNKYHNNSLETDQTRILPTYGNTPIKVSGGRDELRRAIEELQKE
jgi:threonine synthase